MKYKLLIGVVALLISLGILAIVNDDVWFGGFIIIINLINLYYLLKKPELFK